MAINETLKFSWGHIIAFVALILISYVSFMGITYFTNGYFLIAGIGIVVIDILLLCIFIIPQLLKATERKFDKKIKWERFFIFLSPICFVLLTLPYSYFWSVFSNRAQIETIFSESIQSTKGVFVSYEEYANNRLEAYEKTLNSQNLTELQKTNKLEALRLQLLGDNYKELNLLANKWIDNAKNTTVWNVFMIGNVNEIERALDNWNQSLNRYSSFYMSDETKNIKAFSDSDPSIQNAKENLNNLQSIYTKREMPINVTSIITGIFLYFCLLCPYLVQVRNPKNRFMLITKRNFIVKNDQQSSNEEDGGYGSFKL